MTLSSTEGIRAAAAKSGAPRPALLLGPACPLPGSPSREPRAHRAPAKPPAQPEQHCRAVHGVSKGSPQSCLQTPWDPSRGCRAGTGRAFCYTHGKLESLPVGGKISFCLVRFVSVQNAKLSLSCLFALCSAPAAPSPLGERRCREEARSPLPFTAKGNQLGRITSVSKHLCFLPRLFYILHCASEDETELNHQRSKITLTLLISV